MQYEHEQGGWKLTSIDARALGEHAPNGIEFDEEASEALLDNVVARLNLINHYDIGAIPEGAQNTIIEERNTSRPILLRMASQLLVHSGKKSLREVDDYLKDLSSP
ncbi:hypothetical protein BH23PAT1_BH23PAT1_1550 [soil metagenome]